MALHQHAPWHIAEEITDSAGLCTQQCVAADSRRRFVANGFDVVPVGADHEGRVVVGVVLRTNARRTVVAGTCLQGRAIERFDLLPSPGGERHVKTGGLLMGLEKAERSLVLAGQLDAERTLLDDGYAERCERLDEEGLARLVIAHADYDMVEHGCSRSAWVARNRPTDGAGRSVKRGRCCAPPPPPACQRRRRATAGHRVRFNAERATADLPVTS